MSWSRSWAGLALALLLVAAGCGYRPLYGERGPGGTAVQSELASIRIRPIADRPGQLLYNHLRNALNPYGLPDQPRYLLAVQLLEDQDSFFLQRDETATRANLTMRARFTLSRAGTEEVLLQGESRSTTSYNILREQFASLVSEEDARERALELLSEDIRTRLALFLSQRAGG